MVLELTCWNHVLISYNEMSNEMFVSSVMTRFMNMKEDHYEYRVEG